MDMDLNRLRALLAAPMACLFVILILCVFAVQRPVSTGIRIPMMHTRAEPLSNCEFNGFTVYLLSDGQLAGGLERTLFRGMCCSRELETPEITFRTTRYSLLPIPMFLTVNSPL